MSQNIIHFVGTGTVGTQQIGIPAFSINRSVPGNYLSAGFIGNPEYRTGQGI